MTRNNASNATVYLYMLDTLHRFMFDDADIRGEIVTLSESYQAALQQQQLPESARCLLGEFLSAAALIAETLKFEGVLTLQVRGSGAISLIMAEADHQGNVRGIVKLNSAIDAELPEYSQIDLAKIVSDPQNAGVLKLTIDPKSGERYQGIVPLSHPTLAECLGTYFEQSEQLPTKLWLQASATTCGGILLQALPAHKVTDDDIRQDMWNTATQLAHTITPDELFALEHDTLLYRLFHDQKCRLFEPKTLAFRCHCTQERSANAITSLGEADALDLVKQRGSIDIHCEFCGTHYHFNQHDIEHIFTPKNTILH